MIKLGIVGSDNSHADAFSQLCNLDKGFNGFKCRGAKVVAIYGHDPKRTEEVARNGQIPTIVEKADHMIGIVDAVLVVFRHGDLHARYALPFINAKITTFVDKPFAIKTGDAERMLAAARKRKTLLTSFSTLRYAKTTQEFLKTMKSAEKLVSGSIKGPASLQNEYGGLPFYGVHVTELLAAIFGYGVRQVNATEHRGNVHATAIYDDERMVNLQFLSNSTHDFHVTTHGLKGWGEYRIDTAGCYKYGLDLVLEMIRNKKRPLTDDQLLETVCVTDSVVKSYKRGGLTVRL
jgi:predicted dehydrogenase